MSAAVPDDWFADSLTPQATLPAPPVMPQLTRGQRFGDALAAAFGAPVDRVGAFAKGIDARSQYQLRSAQTESALAEAEKRRGEALRQSQINDLINKAQADPSYAPGVSDLLTIATGAGDFEQGRLRAQERGYRSTLADPNAAPAGAFAAGQGVQGRVLPHLYDVGGETVNQITDPNATFETPAQQATVAATKALEGQRNRSPAAAAGGAARPPTGFRFNANGDLEFIPGGPSDPNRQKPPTAQSAAERNKVNSNNAAVAQIDSIIEEVKKNPGAFGAQNFLPETITQRTDPSGVGARSALGNLSSLVIHNRYGSAQSRQELERAGFIPRERDTPEAILSKLQKYRDYVVGETQAYDGGGATPGAAPAGGDLMRKASKSGKPIVSRDGGATWEYE